MAVGIAIERAMKQSSYGKQIPLADALGIDQTSLSKMINGKVAVTIERVAEIERLCHLPQGQILVWAGCISADALAAPGVLTVHNGKRGRRHTVLDTAESDAMSTQAVAIQHDLEVITDPELFDGRPAVGDVHQGRPMRVEYAERGALLSLAWELGWVSF